jgi:hypothetical protein
MKWKSEETLAAYQHYFDEQLDADTRDAFHQRMHQEIQQYLEERKHEKRKQPAPHTVISFDDEPDLAFLYGLAGEA